MEIKTIYLQVAVVICKYEPYQITIELLRYSMSFCTSVGLVCAGVCKPQFDRTQLFIWGVSVCTSVCHVLVQSVCTSVGLVCAGVCKPQFAMSVLNVCKPQFDGTQLFHLRYECVYLNLPFPCSECLYLSKACLRFFVWWNTVLWVYNQWVRVPQYAMSGEKSLYLGW